MTEPIRDGHNLALTLQSLQSGMSVYVKVYEALKEQYQPFHETEFYQAFYRGLQ